MEPSEPPAPVRPEAAEPPRAEVAPELVYQLRFEQFKHVATLSVAAAGGVLILLQAGYLDSGYRSGAAVALFALAAAMSLFGQNALVDAIDAGRGWTRPAQVYLVLSFMLLGAGVGLLADVVL